MGHKMIQKRKDIFGDTIYLDESCRVVGYGHKGIFGEELLFDRNGRYAGSRSKGFLGEDVYVDRNYRIQGYGRKGLGDTRIYVDRDGQYAGWGGEGPGDNETVFLDGNRPGSSETADRVGTVCGLILLAINLGLFAFFVSLFVK